jgi:Arc/MetJ-type ribon-helix-helix transcriptional regulator
MKMITVRIPEVLLAEIEAESRLRKISRSDVIRQRLQLATNPQQSQSAAIEAIADLIGSVEGLPPDLSSRKKSYLKTTGYGPKRTR